MKTFFEGGMKKVWVGIKETLGKPGGGTGTGITTLRAQNGKKVGSMKGKREELQE